MAKILHFRVVPANRPTLSVPSFEVDTLDAAMVDVRDFLNNREFHVYFPVNVVMTDTEGRETIICRIELP